MPNDSQNQDNTTSPAPVIPVATTNMDVPPPPIITDKPIESPVSQIETPPVSSGNSASLSETIIPPVVTAGLGQSSKSPKGFSGVNKKLVATILVILILVGGVGAGIFLTQQQQDIREKAIDLNDPRIPQRCGGSFGTSCPVGQRCNQTVGRCEVINIHDGGGEIPPRGVLAGTSAQCSSIEAYKVTGEPISASTTWTKLTSNDLAKLKSGDVVYFVAKGTYLAGGGSIAEAKIKINNVENNGILKPATQECPSSTCAEFYYKYTVPSNTNSFTLSAKMKYVPDNIWF